MFEKVLGEFTGLTNTPAYVKIFSRRMMRPVPNKIGEFFGIDQRIVCFLLSKSAVPLFPKWADF